MNSQIDAVITALERAPEIVVPLVREVPDTVLRRRPKPHKWSAHEHACHLAVVDAMLSARLDLMLSDPNPHIVPYSPSAAQEDGEFLEMDLAAAMDRYASGRKELVKWLEVLSPADWQRTAKHDEYNRYSVFIMFRHLSLHDLFHAYRIEELLLKKHWE